MSFRASPREPRALGQRGVMRRGRAGAVIVASLMAFFLGMAERASGESVTIAAAADLQHVMPLLTAQFQRATGHRATVTYGSSGNFFSQIQNGAPFDLFFSADIEYPRRLEGEGLIEKGSLYEYATGRIVMWFRKGRPLKVSLGLQALLDVGVRRIAIANPDHAPYGRAAVAALQHEQLYDRVRSKLIRGENVAQAAQFVESGNADAGIIALSLALAPRLRDRGTYYEIPAAFHQPIVQAAAIMKASRHKDAARAFTAFLRTPDALRLMQTFGFSPSSPGGRAQ